MTYDKSKIDQENEEEKEAFEREIDWDEITNNLKKPVALLPNGCTAIIPIEQFHMSALNYLAPDYYIKIIKNKVYLMRMEITINGV